MKDWTQESIDQELSNNFDGEEMEVFESYDGTDDEIIESFDGVSLKNLHRSTRRFGVKIKNTTSEDKDIVLNPGKFRTIKAALVYDDAGTLKYKVPGGFGINAPAGLVVDDVVMTWTDPQELIEAGHRIDIVADDGIVYADGTSSNVTVTASKADARIRHFLEFIKTNPVVFAGIHISADDTDAFETEMVLRKTSPFKVYGEERIPFQDGFIPENQNTKKIIVKRQFQFDGETMVILTIPAGAEVTYSFIAGAVSSQATAMKRKQSMAKAGKRKRHFALGRHIASRRRK